MRALSAGQPAASWSVLPAAVSPGSSTSMPKSVLSAATYSSARPDFRELVRPGGRGVQQHADEVAQRLLGASVVAAGLRAGDLRLEHAEDVRAQGHDRRGEALPFADDREAAGRVAHDLARGIRRLQLLEGRVQADRLEVEQRHAGNGRDVRVDVAGQPEVDDQLAVRALACRRRGRPCAASAPSAPAPRSSCRSRRGRRRRRPRRSRRHPPHGCRASSRSAPRVPKGSTPGCRWRRDRAAPRGSPRRTNRCRP